MKVTSLNMNDRPQMGCSNSSSLATSNMISPIARAQVKPATSWAPLLHRSVANRRTRPADTSKRPIKNPSPHIKDTMFIIDHKKSIANQTRDSWRGYVWISLGEESYPVPTGLTEAMWFEIRLMAIKCGLWYWLAITSLESNETA